MKISTRHALAGAAFAGLLAFAGQAGAAVYTATYTGTVTYLQGSGDARRLFSGGFVDDTFTAVFRWDEAEADADAAVDSPDTNSVYVGPMTATLAFGAFSFAFAGADGLAEHYDMPEGDAVRHTLTNQDATGGYQLMEMRALGGDFLSSWDWRTTGAYDLSGLDVYGSFGVVHVNAAGAQTGVAQATFRPTSLVIASEEAPTSAAPEPSAWALMIVGFGAAGAVLRHGRRRGAPA